MSVDYYRELMADHPHRRAQAENDADDRGGYLFGPGPRQRRLRVLLDLDTLAEDMAGTAVWNQFRRLTGFGHIDLWRVSLSPNQPQPKRGELGVLYLKDLPDVGGWSTLTGSQFGYHLRDHNINRSGVVRLKPTPPQPEPDPDRKHLTRAIVLSEAARAAGADIVVSRAPTVGRADLEVNYETNFFTPEQAVVITAHYLRTQHIYPLPGGSTRTIRQNFYESAVWALAPGVFDWQAKCTRNASQSAHTAACTDMINRFMRALRAFDDLLLHLGQASSPESSEDAAEALDLMLLMLCGAIDVLGRSLHPALHLPGQPKDAKLHIEKNYYIPRIRPLFADHPDIERLDALQVAIQVVFELRNTVHNLSLRAMGGGLNPALGAPVSKGRRTLFIPPDIGKILFGLEEEDRRRWGLHGAASFPALAGLGDRLDGLKPRSADMADFAAMALSSTLTFADQLCRLFASTDIPDKDPVLTGIAAVTHPHLNTQTLTTIGAWMNLPDPLPHD
ncbi:hypothetical protein ABZ413_33595 [Nocardia rhamnosiphila]|uniref:hypothetical protein n=1 Tax=Nocardia rhamnosiphila TaxID=426716 RepID=UPI0033E78A69